jgi:hypothetical protein
MKGLGVMGGANVHLGPELRRMIRLLLNSDCTVKFLGAYKRAVCKEHYAHS